MEEWAPPRSSGTVCPQLPPRRPEPQQGAPLWGNQAGGRSPAPFPLILYVTKVIWSVSLLE